jgi:hypothetical protein
MRVRRLYGILVCVLGVVLMACAPEGPTVPSGPVLVQQNTIEPTLAVPTRLLTETPFPNAQVDVSAPTNIPANLEVLSPLEVVTVQADFIFVTPTHPPSKTPTTTPTFTPTITITPSPTVTVTATATRQLFPTSVIMPVEAPVSAPVDRICDSQWFFLEPRPASCPMAPPTASQGVYQEFENGYMIWLGALQAIYVMYNDYSYPRWQVFRDSFNENTMPWDDPQYANAPRANIWQPRRGFGLLWRGDANVRNRIGWATMEWESPYSMTVQQSADNSLFLTDPSNRVFGLFSNGTEWQRYGGFGN